MRIAILFNAPVRATDDADRLSEAGVTESVEAIAKILVGAGHEVESIPLARAADALALAAGDLAVRADVVVNLLEGVGGCPHAEPWLAGLLELTGVAYTGSPPEALALTHDKQRTARLLAGYGLLVPESLYVAEGAAPPEPELAELLAGGPVIVKPAREDASLGIDATSVVRDSSAATARIAGLAARFGDVLVERYIDGRELNLGVVAIGGVRALPAAEIEFAPGAPRIVTYDAKWRPGSGADLATPVRCPAVVNPDLAAELERVALAAWHACGCRDYARVDVRVDADGRVWVLEVNGNPDLAPSAGLARAAAVAGIDYRDLVLGLVAAAAHRRRGPAPSGLRPASSTPPTPLGVAIRPVAAHDLPALVAMTAATGLFRADEVEVADEVLTAAVAGDDYVVAVAIGPEGGAVGWACHGLVPMTDATYDLYWIVVDPKCQGAGIGRQLLTAAERSVAAAGGRWLLAETSSTETYHPTRAFYDRCGYRVVGDVPDFYRVGDGRVTYGKRVDGAMEGK